jgi:hypothetical protein
MSGHKILVELDESSEKKLREWADIYKKSLSVLATDIVMGYIKRMGGYESIMRAMSDVAYSSTGEANNE